MYAFDYTGVREVEPYSGAFARLYVYVLSLIVVLNSLNKPMGSLTMRKVLITMGYISLVFKLTAMPAQANSDGDYRDSIQMQQYDEEDDLSFLSRY